MSRRLLASRLAPPVVTPLVRHDGVCLKWEGVQPSGSVKYRLVHARVLEGIARGEITADTTLTEASQGRVALALAHVGKQLGLPVELHCGPDLDDAFARELDALGALVVKHDSLHALPAILAQLEGRARDGSCFYFGQYRRDVLLHGYAALGAEVAGQLAASNEQRPHAFVCPIGTGGLFQGVGVQLRRLFPDLRLIAVEAKPGEHFAGVVRNTETLSLGPDDPYDRRFADETWFIERPPAPRVLDGHALAPSAAAILELAAERELRDFLLITPE